MLWLIKIFIFGLAVLLHLILAPVFAIFLQPDNRLPESLWLFAVGDDDMIGSGEPDAPRTGSRYLDCVLWQWRNPAWGIQQLLGAAFTDTGLPVHLVGDPLVSDEPYRSGWYWLAYGGAWEFYGVWPTFPGRCLRIRIGYKIGVWTKGLHLMAPIVCVVNPFKRRG